MKSHPESYNRPFTLLFHLPFEPIWLTGHKWGHLFARPLKPGDYLLARDGGSIPTRSTCCWPWLAGLAPDSPFRVCSPSVTAGVCEELGLADSHAGLPRAPLPSLPAGSYRGLRVASSAGLPHCCSLLLRSPCPARQSRSRARTWAGAARRAPGTPQHKLLRCSPALMVCTMMPWLSRCQSAILVKVQFLVKSERH